MALLISLLHKNVRNNVSNVEQKSGKPVVIEQHYITTVENIR